MFSSFLQKIARTVLLAMLLLVGALPAVAWTGPSTAPPGGNTSAPVNVNATGQTKTGFLGINGGYNGAGYPFSVGGAAGTWTAIFNWPYNATPSGSIGILVGGVYSQFENPSGYYAELANGSYGLETNGNVWAQDYYDNASGAWLSTSSGGIAMEGMWEEYSNGVCMVGNPWTGGCSCPAVTPNARYAAIGNSNNGSWAFELYYCTK